MINPGFLHEDPYDQPKGMVIEEDLPDEREMVAVEELPDGSTVYEFGEDQEEAEKEQEDFYKNLAEDLDKSTLSKLAQELMDGVNQDIESRKQWEQDISRGLKLLGFKLEDYKEVPFFTVCSAFDSTLSQALIRFWATARAELFPAEGPCKYEVLGESTDELEKQGEQLKDFLNYFLTNMDKEYYKDSERLLLYCGLTGSAFRKVWQDPIKKHPLSRFIDPQNFIVNVNCTSLLSSDRITHVCHYTRKEVILNQMSGAWLDTNIKEVSGDDMEDDSQITKTVQQMEGITHQTTSQDVNKNSILKFYEIYTDQNLKDYEHLDGDEKETGMPLPYIVTLCAANSSNPKIVSIRRNWAEDDDTYTRIECFTQYCYFPGFGFYGLGLLHILGSNSEVLTSTLRQLVDAGTLANYPGGLMAKGMRNEQNDKAIAPGEFRAIETGGLPISDVIMPMPYKEPSSGLNELRKELAQRCEMLGGMAEQQIGEMNSNAPVGTTLALLEVAQKPQSSVMRSLHVSLGHELQLLYGLFKEHLPENPYQFMMPGKSGEITREHFHEQLRVIPVSDPNATTSTQRVMRAEALLRMAQSAPEIHDMRKAYHRMYLAMNVQDISEILPEEKEAVPLDPISENMNAIEGKPLKAALYQDHKAHMEVHNVFMQTNPDAQAGLQAHIQEHRAFDYLVTMQMAMGTQLPPPEVLMQNPEIQNQIAVMAAQAAQQQLQQQQQANPPPLDPNAVMMADIQQKKEAAELRREEVNLKTETDSFKAQLKFESDIKKLDVEQELAEQKSEVDLQIAFAKLEVEMAKLKQTQEQMQLQHHLQAHDTAFKNTLSAATLMKEDTRNEI